MYFVDVGVKMCLLLTSTWQPSIVRLRHAAATLFVLGFVLPASALTIGRPQGAAWIGKPLNIVIPLTLDGSEVGGSLCPQVEVVQGDASMDERRVSISLEPGAAPDAPRLRVRTSRAVEEPIVTLTVKAGCSATSTRQVVLLADPPPVDAALPSFEAPAESTGGANAAVPAQSSPRASRAARAGASGEGGAERRRASQSASGATATRSAVPERQNAEAPARRRAAPAARASSPAGSSGGRLQVDALAPLAPRETAASTAPAAQRATPAQAAAPAVASAPTPAASEPARNEGAAVVPQPAASAPAVPAPTPEAVRDAQRTVALEQALASLREQTTRNEQTLLEMRRELAAARESRYNNPLVYALVALLLLALVALVWMWLASRRAAQSVWWPEEGGAAPVRSSRFGALEDTADTFPGEDNAGAARALASGAAAGTMASGSLSQGVPPGFIDPDAPRVANPSEPDGQHADLDAPALAGQHAPPSRSVNTEELFDVQQQAEFFLSLGQHEQAIAVLSEYVADHPDTSALAYLELLRIFHSLGRMLDYERVRRQCQQALNVRVPSFDDFHQDAGRPLDHHNEVLQRIEEHWPGPESLPVIEELLFRRPGEDGQPTFDLAAYRELLMLYAMAQEQPAGADTQRPSLAEVLMRHQQHETLPMALPTSAVELPTARQSLGPDTPLVEPRHPDFQPTRPPHPLTASLDFDLDGLDMAGVDTMPAALRRAAAEKASSAAPVIEPSALDQPTTELASAAPPETPSAQLPDLELFDPEIEESIKPGSFKR
jgi:hypothetical protein